MALALSPSHFATLYLDNSPQARIMQARQLSRELALLSLSQLPNKAVKEGQDINLEDIMLAAVRVLGSEAREGLEEAASELGNGSERLLSSDISAVDITSAAAMLRQAMDYTEKAINSVRRAMEIPELLQMANRPEVQRYALQIARGVKRNKAEIDGRLDRVMEGWRLGRLPAIDQDILRVAIAEFTYLGLAAPVAINAAVELAKRYSDDEGRRLINGVLRRAVDSPGGDIGGKVEANVEGNVESDPARSDLPDLGSEPLTERSDPLAE
jgi:transcription antitermination protein NusB